MTTKLIRPPVIEYRCDWCDEAEEHAEPRQPINWYHLHGPRSVGSASEVLLLCPPCGMRATSALIEARNQAAERRLGSNSTKRRLGD
jgi:hypothetical protein